MSATTHRASFGLQPAHPSRRIYASQLAVTTVVVTITLQGLSAGSSAEVVVNGASVPDGVIDSTTSRTFALSASGAITTVDLVLRGSAAGGTAVGYYDISIYT